MKVTPLLFEPSRGWSRSLPTELDGPEAVVFVFGAPDIGSDGVLRSALDDLRQAFPRAILAGCSTAGEIHGTEIRDRSLSVAVASLERSTAQFASAEVGTNGGSFEAGKRIAEDLYRPDLRSIHVFSEGLHVNGSDLVRGLNAVLPPEVVATGGLAADGSRFGRTWVLDRGIPRENRVTAVGLYGNGVRASHGSRGGWDIFGPERHVTRAEGNVLYELDGKPALDLYKRYLGDQAEGLPSTALLFPLALRTSKEAAKTLVRTVLSVDEHQKSMTFAGDIPHGAFAQLMHANFDRLIYAASEAANAAAGSRPKIDSLTIAVSCVGRRLILGERADEEVEAVFSSLPQPTTLIGFYSYGEISPYASGQCDLHNQTMTLTTIWEEAA